MSFIHTQVAMAVWDLQGWLWEEWGRRNGGTGQPPACEQLRVQALILCPHTVAQTAKSKSKELKDMEVSSNNQRISGGQSLARETPSCFQSDESEFRVSREYQGRGRKVKSSRGRGALGAECVAWEAGAETGSRPFPSLWGLRSQGFLEHIHKVSIGSEAGRTAPLYPLAFEGRSLGCVIGKCGGSRRLEEMVALCPR